MKKIIQIVMVFAMSTLFVSALVQATNARWLAFTLLLSILVSIPIVAYFIPKLWRANEQYSLNFGEQKKIRLKVTDDGFGVKPSGICKQHRTFLAWADINEISVYNADCHSAHRVFMKFKSQTNANKYIKVHEDMNGWQALTNAIAKRFPDFRFENFEKVKALFPQQGSLVCWKRQCK